jgi:hypothetical protein
VDVGLDVADSDTSLFALSFVPGASGSITLPDGPIVPAPVEPPGPLAPLDPGETYRLGVDVVEGTTATEFLGADPFEYSAAFRNDHDVTFGVDDAGAILAVRFDPDALVWTCVPPGATGFDVVRGDLRALRTAGLSGATQACEVDDHPTTALSVGADPASGAGTWYLVRVVTTEENGSYSSGGAGEQAGRDAAVAASGLDCP